MEKCKINSECLAVLKYKYKKLSIEYSDIKNIFSKEINYYKNNILKDDEKYELKDLKKLLEFLKINISLNKMSMEYRYCTDMTGVFQRFTVNIEDEINLISDIIFFIENNNLHQKNIEFSDNKKIESLIDVFHSITSNNIRRETSKVDIYSLSDDISAKLIINYSTMLETWSKAYSIQQKYKECDSNKDILFFSHRIDGWSSPACYLNNDLSAEFKTNFGYGKSSYFYIKLKYKSIEIIPFSDLVKYECAGFYQINQYTRKYENVENKDWNVAFKFLVKAYNLLNYNEHKFIKKFIINEIDTLIKKLQKLLISKHFSFEKIKHNSNKEEKQFKGFELSKLRAVKISNSLIFIEKIKDFKEIMDIEFVINKIELFNKKMLVILPNEINLIGAGIKKTNVNMKNIRPVYIDISKTVNNLKIKELGFLKEQGLHKSFDDIDTILTNKYPELLSKYKKLNEKFYSYNNELNLNKSILRDLIKCNRTINSYFQSKSIDLTV